jgi:hypothetical protein
LQKELLSVGEHVSFIMACQLKKDTPENVLNSLKLMTENPDSLTEESYDDLPDHPFFDTEVCNLILRSAGGTLWDSHSFLQYDEGFKTNRLYIRTSVKQGLEQISLFLQWLAPYCVNGAKLGSLPPLHPILTANPSPEVIEEFLGILDEGFVGYMKPEYAHHPTLIYFEAGKVTFLEITAAKQQSVEQYLKGKI